MERFTGLHLNKSLTRINLGDGPTLSGNQQKIMNIIRRRTTTPLSEVFVKSGLSFSEVDSILKNLIKIGNISINNKIISTKNISFNPEKMNFILKPKYLNLEGQKQKPRFPENKVVEFLKSKRMEIKAKKLAYLPFYKIVTDNGTKYLDSLSYSLRP
jgi:hypothetical protein